MAAESLEHRHTAASAVSALLLLLPVRTAWMSDDAYLTLRTVDNWLHGYGLRWNPLERGVNVIQDPALAAYDDRLRTITQGPIWTLKRARVILRMNLGLYDYLIRPRGR
jgi:hypothetical protein